MVAMYVHCYTSRNAAVQALGGRKGTRNAGYSVDAYLGEIRLIKDAYLETTFRDCIQCILLDLLPGPWQSVDGCHNLSVHAVYCS